MFHHIEDFIRIWKAEAERTESLLQKIPDEGLDKKPVPALRTIGRLIWHIIETPKEMLERTGLKVIGPEWGTQPPKSIQEIIEMHRQVANSVVKMIQENWTDDSLNELDDMYGERWKKRQTLSALLLHTIHHRSQLTVLMRAADIEVTGLYGPAKHEWAAMGLEPME